MQTCLSKLRYSSFEPVLKLQWCRVQDIDGSHIPVTTHRRVWTAMVFHAMQVPEPKGSKGQVTAFHVRRSQTLLCTFQANLHWMKISHFVMKASGTLLWQLLQVLLFPRAFSCSKSIKNESNVWNLVKVNNKDTRMTSLCFFMVNFEQGFSGCRDVLVFSLLPLNK